MSGDAGTACPLPTPCEVSLLAALGNFICAFSRAARGASTHGWGRPMATAGVSAYRVARDATMAYGLSDPPNPSAQYTKTPALWAKPLSTEPKAKPTWAFCCRKTWA